MKKILLYTGALALLLSSCEKSFIEEENRSNATAEEFYLTAEGYESLVNANYGLLRDIYGPEPWLFCAGTDLYAEGRDQEPPGLSQYTQLNSASEGVDHLYNTCYESIQKANMAIHYSTLTEQTSVLDERVGEIKYLRANAFFLLVQTYGGVSLVTEYFSAPQLSFGRNSAEEVYDFIVEELKDAIDRLPDANFNGRVTKRAAQHLLAKVYLAKGYEDFGSTQDFTDAASYADMAIAGEGLSLGFEELWTPGNELNSEVLFSVQFSSGSVSAAPTELGHMQTAYFGPYMGGSEVAGDAPYRTFTLCPTQFAIGLYDQGDERWDATFMVEVFERYYDYFDVDDHSSLNVAHYYAPKWASSTVDTMAYRVSNPNAEIKVFGDYSASTGGQNNDYGCIAVKKFDDPNAPFDGGRVSTRDIILSRLGETYLVAAEAYLQSGNPGMALTRLNEVRDRANATPAVAGDMNIDYILDERGRELMGEYHRWFDLKRTGKLVERAAAHHYLIEEANFSGANGELKILRPIPQSAIDLNRNTDFQQNPAYQ